MPKNMFGVRFINMDWKFLDSNGTESLHSPRAGTAKPNRSDEASRVTEGILSDIARERAKSCAGYRGINHVCVEEAGLGHDGGRVEEGEGRLPEVAAVDPEDTSRLEEGGRAVPKTSLEDIAARNGVALELSDEEVQGILKSVKVYWSTANELGMPGGGRGDTGGSGQSGALSPRVAIRFGLHDKQQQLQLHQPGYGAFAPPVSNLRPMPSHLGTVGRVEAVPTSSPRSPQSQRPSRRSQAGGRSKWLRNKQSVTETADATATPSLQPGHKPCPPRTTPVDPLDAETDAVLSRVSVNLIDAKLEADAIVRRVLAEKRAEAMAYNNKGRRVGKGRKTGKTENKDLPRHARHTILNAKAKQVLQLVKGCETFIQKDGDAREKEGHGVGGKVKVHIPNQHPESYKLFKKFCAEEGGQGMGKVDADTNTAVVASEGGSQWIPRQRRLPKFLENVDTNAAPPKSGRGVK